MGCQKTENYVNAFYERSLTKMATSSTYRMPRFFAYRYIFFFQSCNSPRLDIRSQTFTNNDLLFFSCRKKVQAISFEPVECWAVSSWWLFIQKIWERSKVEIIIQIQTTNKKELYQQISMWLQWTFQNLVVFKDMRF